MFLEKSLKIEKNSPLSDASGSCPSANNPSSPDFSKLNFDSYPEFLDKLNPEPDQKTPKKTDLIGPPLALILPYFMMEPKYKCTPPKFLVCCRIADIVTKGRPTLCYRCE